MALPAMPAGLTVQRLTDVMGTKIYLGAVLDRI